LSFPGNQWRLPGTDVRIPSVAWNEDAAFAGSPAERKCTADCPISRIAPSCRKGLLPRTSGARESRCRMPSDGWLWRRAQLRAPRRLRGGEVIFAATALRELGSELGCGRDRCWTSVDNQSC